MNKDEILKKLNNVFFLFLIIHDKFSILSLNLEF